MGRNTKISTKKTKIFFKCLENHSSVLVWLYEGERVMKSDNNLLKPQIEVSFAIDEDGILNVMAMDKSSRKQNCIAITELIKPMPNNAENLKQVDEEERAADQQATKENYELMYRNLESLCNSISSTKDLGP
ncbi:unnamed protein product [Taenia asiatica]|uniref:Uncharacterized protein n=1 Tax=Taenia asiatica TaxID=60517 RepID=A0A0R3WHA0_TAEAS|nr:unnamed protein product [Taenia asiatica]